MLEIILLEYGIDYCKIRDTWTMQAFKMYMDRRSERMNRVKTNDQLSDLSKIAKELKRA